MGSFFFFGKLVQLPDQELEARGRITKSCFRTVSLSHCVKCLKARIGSPPQTLWGRCAAIFPLKFFLFVFSAYLKSPCHLRNTTEITVFLKCSFQLCSDQWDVWFMCKICKSFNAFGLVSILRDEHFDHCTLVNHQ